MDENANYSSPKCWWFRIGSTLSLDYTPFCEEQSLQCNFSDPIYEPFRFHHFLQVYTLYTIIFCDVTDAICSHCMLHLQSLDDMAWSLPGDTVCKINVPVGTSISADIDKRGTRDRLSMVLDSENHSEVDIIEGFNEIAQSLLSNISTKDDSFFSNSSVTSFHFSILSSGLYPLSISGHGVQK